MICFHVGKNPPLKSIQDTPTQGSGCPGLCVSLSCCRPSPHRASCCPQSCPRSPAGLSGLCPPASVWLPASRQGQPCPPHASASFCPRGEWGQRSAAWASRPSAGSSLSQHSLPDGLQPWVAHFPGVGATSQLPRSTLPGASGWAFSVLLHRTGLREAKAGPWLTEVRCSSRERGGPSSPAPVCVPALPVVATKSRGTGRGSALKPKKVSWHLGTGSLS